MITKPKIKKFNGISEKTIKRHMKFIKPLIRQGVSNRRIAKTLRYSEGYIKNIITGYFYMNGIEWARSYHHGYRQEQRRKTIDGLNRARAEGKVLGRPKGSKDKTQRRKAGYFK